MLKSPPRHARLIGKIDKTMDGALSDLRHKSVKNVIFPKEVYSEQVSPGEFKDWATKKQCKTLVASLGNQPVGFIIAEKRPYNSLGDFAIAVSPSQQRRGLGGALLDAGLNALYQIGVKRVIADYRMFNGATHALYGGRGFKPSRVYNYFLVAFS